MKLRFVFCIAILSTAATALASETPQNDKPAQAPAATDGAAAMRVFVDPATGELVSKPVTEAQRYAAEADTSFEETKSRAVESAATDGSGDWLGARQGLARVPASRRHLEICPKEWRQRRKRLTFRLLIVPT